MLKNAEIVSDQSKSDEVGINNTVTLYMEDDDEEETYKIVTSIRGNSMKGHISTESPMGKALLGHKVGERVYIKVNENFGYYAVIRRIENTDDGGDEIRKFWFLKSEKFLWKDCSDDSKLSIVRSPSTVQYSAQEYQILWKLKF